jgi:hypothetical protein
VRSLVVRDFGGPLNREVAMRRSVAGTLSVLMLLATGVLGVYSGTRELGDAHTRLQKSVTIGLLVYGALGLAATAAMLARHRSAVWLATLWGVVVTYVASTAALAYAGSDATIVGAVAAGIASALIAVGVVWGARVMTRRAGTAG